MPATAVPSAPNGPVYAFEPGETGVAEVALHG
jgi:hypothetical protein